MENTNDKYGANGRDYEISRTKNTIKFDDGEGRQLTEEEVAELENPKDCKDDDNVRV